MDSTDTRIANKLSETFSNKKKTIFTTGIQNCLILEREDVKTYSFFNCFNDNDFISHELVTIIAHKSPNREIIKRHTVDFQSLYRERSKGVHNIEVNILTHPHVDNLSLVTFTYCHQDQKRVKLALLDFNLDLALGKQQSIIIQEINTSKTVQKVEWHPTRDQFLVLTKEELKLFTICNEDGETELQVPLFSYRFKDINISQSIIDFQFWPEGEIYSKFVVALYTEIGDVHLVICSPDKNDELQEQQQQFLEGNGCEISEKRSMIKWRTLIDNSKEGGKRNGQLLRVIEIGERLTLLVKTSYAVRDSIRKTYLQISSLFENNLEFKQNILITITDQAASGSISYLMIFPMLIDESLYYVYRHQLLRIDLRAHIEYLTSPPKTFRNYGPSTVKIDTILHLGEKPVKFLQFEKNCIKILRQGSQRWDFASVSLLSIELKCSNIELKAKLSDLFNNMQKMIENSKKTYNIGNEFQIDKIQNFKESGTQKDVEANCQKVQLFLKKIDSQLEIENQNLKKLFNKVKQQKENFEKENYKKRELGLLLQKISKNEEELKRLIDSKGQDNDKIELVKNLISYVNSKSIDLDSQSQQSFIMVAQQQLQKLQQVEKQINRCEQDLYSLAL